LDWFPFVIVHKLDYAAIQQDLTDLKTEVQILERNNSELQRSKDVYYNELQEAFSLTTNWKTILTTNTQKPR